MDAGEAVPGGRFVTTDKPELDDVCLKFLLNHNLVNCLEPVGTS